MLVAVEGDLDPGTEFRITPHERVPIGRSQKGVTLLDPMVSIQHAEVYFDLAAGYVIRDLDSATGTWVDEVCLKGESRPIGVGHMLRFGETVFRVRQATPIPMWLRLTGLMVLLGAALFGLFSLLRTLSAVQFEIELVDPVMILDREHETLLPDAEVLRSLGRSIREYGVVRVTDYDRNAIEELWLQRGDGSQLVITFPRDARTTSDWEVIGILPPGCVGDFDVQDHFPILNCEDQTYAIYEGETAYELVDHEGAVVFYRPPKTFLGIEVEPDPQEDPANGLGISDPRIQTPIEVARLSVKNVEKLASFLTDHDVAAPVHYLICEGAFEGIAAQAVTYDGRVQKLNQGCHSDLRLEGDLKGVPVAVALSASGHQALINDVTTFYAGHPDGIFLPVEREALRASLVQRPGFLKGNAKLAANPFASTPGVFDPKPDRPISGRARLLEYTNIRITPANIAYTAEVSEDGVSQIVLEGCGTLRVDTEPFIRTGLQSLLGSSAFSTIEDVSTGQRILNVPYTTGYGAYTAQLGSCELRAAVEGILWGRAVEVVRYRISYRKK